MKRRVLSFGMGLALLAAHTVSISQQDYPTKPIRLIVPYPPGASTDALGRLVAQKMAATMGQPVVVENRGGASGNIGTEVVARSAPDGYTFGLGTDATHAANAHLFADPQIQPLRDFTPLALAVTNPIVLVVHPSVPATNLRELLAYLKANPAQGSYGTSGSGSPHHLAGELLKQRSGIPLVHVPYRGGGPALTDAIGGQIPMLFSSVITALPHIKDGRLKPIAVTSAARFEGLPNVPTVAETIEGYEMLSWLAFFGPAKLPEPIARRLSTEIVKALRDPENQAKLTAGGLVVMAAGPAELAALQRKDSELKGKLIREVGIKID